MRELRKPRGGHLGHRWHSHRKQSATLRSMCSLVLMPHSLGEGLLRAGSQTSEEEALPSSQGGTKRLVPGAHKELDVSQPLLLRQRASAKVTLKWNSKKTKGTSPSSRRAVPLELQETSCRGRRYQGTSGRDKHSPTEGQEGAER